MLLPPTKKPYPALKQAKLAKLIVVLALSQNSIIIVVFITLPTCVKFAHQSQKLAAELTQLTSLQQEAIQK